MAGETWGFPSNNSSTVINSAASGTVRIIIPACSSTTHTTLQWVVNAFVGQKDTPTTRARLMHAIQSVGTDYPCDGFYTTSSNVATRWVAAPPPRVNTRWITGAQRMTAERERDAWIERDRQIRQNQEVMQKAQARARKLLVSHLDPIQRASLESNGYFDVPVGNKIYRIRQGTHGNVRLLRGSTEVVSYCIQPDGVPAEDAMLAQKLTLECDEPTFLRVANATRLLA